MQASALAEKMKHRKPDIYVQPEIQGVRMLDFGKAEEVSLQAAPAVDLLRKQLLPYLPIFSTLSLDNEKHK
jgi:NTE family protein